MENNCSYYCYLDDAMGIDTSETFRYEQCGSCIICDKCAFKDRINGICYRDPDTYSRQLYEDVAVVYSKQAEKLCLGITIRKVIYKTHPYLYINDSRYSTDYIGPSRSKLGAKSENVSMEDENIGDALRICRTIGGHIFWPGCQIGRKHTINQARGGTPLLDRIDYTLAELKNYLDDINSTPKYSKALFEAFERYKEWFEVFGERGCKDTFKKFIEFFMLEEFVNDDGEVINLAESASPPSIINSTCELFTKDSYKCFSDSLKRIIINRTERIMQFAKEHGLITMDIKNNK